MFSNSNPLYLQTDDPDNPIVEFLLDNGLILSEADELPRFELSFQNHKGLYRSISNDTVGDFKFFKHWQRLKNQSFSLKKDPLFKAIGGKNFCSGKKILDMSCGTGKDSLLLLRMGGNVVAYERNFIVYCLLKFYEYSMQEADFFPSERFLLCSGTPKEDLHFTKPDVIYFDPMYGESSNKKTAPRKEMADFRSFIGNDEDFLDHLSWAIKNVKNRVVLKKPIRSEPFLSDYLSHSIFGKSTRFDIYMAKIL